MAGGSVTVLHQGNNHLSSRVHLQIEALGTPSPKLGKDTTADADTITLLIPVVPTMEYPAKFAEASASPRPVPHSTAKACR